MESDKTLEQELAEEIRAAVREAAPPAPADGPGNGVAPDPLAGAEAHLTPAIPEGARLSTLKKALLRGLRFLWRDQAAFNVRMLEALRRARQEQAALVAKFAAAGDARQRDLAEARRRTAIQDARFALLEASPRGTSTPGGVPMEPRSLPPGVYSLFEERFRGTPESIAENQRFYLPLLRGAPGPVFDAGCGRGELLRLLREEGLPARGVDTNPLSVRLCREAGLDAEEADALEWLEAREPESLGAVVAIQVVEHWTAAQAFAFLAAARRALKPGGVLIAETVNTDSLSALRAFFLDPTHVRPVPPGALCFLAEAAGFPEARIEYRAPLAPRERLSEASENDAKLNRLLFGPQDYALVARLPGP